MKSGWVLHSVFLIAFRQVGPLRHCAIGIDEHFWDPKPLGADARRNLRKKSLSRKNETGLAWKRLEISRKTSCDCDQQLA